MSQNMQPGDLALTLVPDSEIPQGSQVLLAEKIERGQMLYGKDRQMAAPTAGWYVTQPGSSVKVAYGDAELMPLRGEFQVTDSTPIVLHRGRKVRRIEGAVTPGGQQIYEVDGHRCWASFVLGVWEDGAPELSPETIIGWTPVRGEAGE